MYSFPFPLTIIFGTSMSSFLLHYSFLRYTSRPSSVANLALSLLRDPFSSFPRICGQFGAAEPPTDRERIRHTAAPTVPSHFEKYPGKMIRPLLRPGLFLSLSSYLPPSFSLCLDPRFAPSQLWSPSTSSSLFHGSRLLIVSSSCPRLRRPLPLAGHHHGASSWRFFFPSTKCAMRTERNRFIVPPRRFGSRENSRDRSRERYGRVRHDSL